MLVCAMEFVITQKVQGFVLTNKVNLACNCHNSAVKNLFDMLLINVKRVRYCIKAKPAISLYRIIEG